MDVYKFIQFCFFGFGMYNILYLILKAIPYFRTKIKFEAIDKAARYTLVFLGCVYMLVYIIDWIVIFSNPLETSHAFMIERLKGRYGFGLYTQHIYYFISCLLLLVPIVIRNTILRLIVGSMLLIHFERFVIIVTSLHRDYLPSSWSMYQDYFFGYLILGWFIKLALFLGLTTVTYLIINRKTIF